jgi:hypothetical protein
MMSLATIRELAREQAERAASEGIEPLIIWDREDIRSIPNIGDHEPEGWELVESHFVDSSGFGSPGEPALTLDQFMAKLVMGRGYAIIQEGQFQIYVGEFIQV